MGIQVNEDQKESPPVVFLKSNEYRMVFLSSLFRLRKENRIRFTA